MSQSYRLYCLDGVGKIVTAEWIDAADDAEAARIARANKSTLAREVWDRTRLVTRVEADVGR